MGNKATAFPLEHLIVMNATGAFDLTASKSALRAVAAEPSFDSQTEVLMDLRDISCQLSTLDIYALAVHMAFPNPALDTSKRIAVLVSGHLSFDHAHFFELCATNRNVNVRAFDDYDAADAWLHADLPPDPKENP